MKRLGAVVGVLAVAVAITAMACSTGSAPQRPKILGIQAVQVLASDYKKSVEFYAQILGKTDRDDLGCPQSNQPDAHCATIFRLKTGQRLTVAAPEDEEKESPQNFVRGIEFVSDNTTDLFKYLKSEGIELKALGKEGAIAVIVQDPEGHNLSFSQARAGASSEGTSASAARNMGIIHAGFIVTDRAKMDHFYHDILGFHLYWQGGMKDDRVDWVSMQVPDGTDWIEYMLNVPADASKHLLGVMNHIALGVPDVRAAAEQLKKNGVKVTEEPKIGRDGKWQLNLYDPDDTRVELMEFTPVEKPCCSEFTGKHPGP